MCLHHLLLGELAFSRLLVVVSCVGFHFHLCCLWSSKHVYYYYHSVLSCSQVRGLIVCKCGNKKQREEIRYPITLLELFLGELVHLLLFLVFVGHDIVFLVFFWFTMFFSFNGFNFFIMWFCSYLWSLPM